MKKQLAAEYLGTLLLVATVVGSGIMADQLAGGITAIALLGNTLATGTILIVLITILGPLSGAHFNPVVSLAFYLTGDIKRHVMLSYIAVQIIGGLSGTLLAHHMFDLPLIELSQTTRHGMSQWSAEIVATFGLLLTIFGCIRYRPDFVATAVGLFITAGYWFTASTSFANPAVTIARSITNTFSGIAPADMPYFIVAQVVGALLAVAVATWLFHPSDNTQVTTITEENSH